MAHDRDTARAREAPFGAVNDTGGVDTTARTAAEEVAADAVERAETVRDAALAQTRAAGREIRGQARSAVLEGKAVVADRVDGVARSLRASGEELRDQRQGQLATLNDALAQGLEHSAGYLRDRDLVDMAADARTMARRRPLVFFGGLFALGVLTAAALRLEERPTGRARGYEGGPT